MTTDKLCTAHAWLAAVHAFARMHWLALARNEVPTIFAPEKSRIPALGQQNDCSRPTADLFSHAALLFLSLPRNEGARLRVSVVLVYMSELLAIVACVISSRSSQGYWPSCEQPVRPRCSDKGTESPTKLSIEDTALTCTMLSFYMFNFQCVDLCIQVLFSFFLRYGDLDYLSQCMYIDT